MPAFLNCILTKKMDTSEPAVKQAQAICNTTSWASKFGFEGHTSMSIKVLYGDRGLN